MNKAVSFALAGLLSAFCAVADAKTLIIYHTSDVHGWYSSREVKYDNGKSTRAVGGFAALSAAAKKEKSPVLFMDSGDWFQGTPEGNMTRGMATITMMNKLGYSASSLGNHEYDFGEDNLKKILASAKFQIVDSNIRLKDGGDLVSYTKPYTVVEVDGLKIGVVGAITPETRTSVMPTYVKHIDFTNPAVEIAKYLPELKKKGVNAVVALVHDGAAPGNFRLDGSKWAPSKKDIEDGNIAIARSAGKGELAVVFGGHAHTTINPPYTDPETGTMFVESGSNLYGTSRVEMTFDDKTGKLTGVSDRFVELWIDETGEDKEVLDAFKPIAETVGVEMNKRIGETSGDLWRYKKDGTDLDSPLGDYIADVMLATGKADIAIHNTHGIRADIPAGPITNRSVYQALPFENTLVNVDLTGSQILDLVRDGLRPDSSVLQVSGLEVKFSVDEKGAVSDVSITFGGKPLEMEKVYKIATNNYLAAGGSGGRVFKFGKNLQDTMLSIRDAVVNDITARKTLAPLPTGRIARKK